MKHNIGNLVKEVTSGLILHQVNCQGVMGSGIAKELRETYPVVWEKYKHACDEAHIEDGRQGETLLGTVQLVRVTDTLIVANVFGQQFYGRDPRRRYTSYDALDKALETLAWMLPARGLTGAEADIHHPLIGCGLGGGRWEVVKSLIELHLGKETTLWTLP